MFKDNKYTKTYYKIITKARSETRECYTEKHHIVPKSMGGDDKSTNIVKLTAREHFICHWLLTKMVEGNHIGKMIKALHFMRTGSKKFKEERYSTKITSRVFASLKGKYVVSDETRQKNREAALNMSQETKDKISAASKGHKSYVRDDAFRERARLARLGRVATDEQRAKMSLASKGKPKSEEHKHNISLNHKSKKNTTV